MRRLWRYIENGGTFMGILIILIAIIVPLSFVLSQPNGKKRGCGRGCPTCQNRFICHPGQYSKEEEK